MFNILNYTGANASNLLTAFNEFSADDAAKFANMWPKSESPNKLNSAVLGMLSLSQSHQFPMQYSYNNGLPQSNFQIHSSTNGDEARHGSSTLPLTPPGSPNDAKGLVIASPVKTPCKSGNNDCQQNCTVQQSTNHSAPNHGMNVGHDSIAQNLNDYSSASGSQHYQLASFLNAAECFDASAVSLALNTAAGGHQSPSLTNRQRSRSEKRPIPVDLKDEKYFERRRRNNVAAKKSRDVRKYREDEIATRAAYLEKENAILRAQMATLHEEASSLRQLLMQKRQRQMQMHLQQPSTMSLG